MMRIHQPWDFDYFTSVYRSPIVMIICSYYLIIVLCVIIIMQVEISMLVIMRMSCSASIYIVLDTALYACFNENLHDYWSKKEKL